MANVSIKNYEDSNGNKKYFFRIRLGDKVQPDEDFIQNKKLKLHILI